MGLINSTIKHKEALTGLSGALFRGIHELLNNKKRAFNMNKNQKVILAVFIPIITGISVID